jgi:hypothetical protein
LPPKSIFVIFNILVMQMQHLGTHTHVGAQRCVYPFTQTALVHRRRGRFRHTGTEARVAELGKGIQQTGYDFGQRAEQGLRGNMEDEVSAAVAAGKDDKYISDFPSCLTRQKISLE